MQNLHATGIEIVISSLGFMQAEFLKVSGKVPEKGFLYK